MANAPEMLGKPDHLPQLDGLRGIACLMVLLGHYGDRISLAPGWQGEGVYLFFALSGFLITRNLLADRGNGRRARDFYVKRCARLMPLFFIAVAAAAVWNYSGVWFHGVFEAFNIQPPAAPGGWVWAHTVLYVANIDGRLFPGLYHFWSLLVEEHYYLFWPLVVWFFPVRAGVKAAWFLAAMSPVIALAGLAWFERFPGLVAWNYQAGYILTTSNLTALLIGSAVAFNESWWRSGRRLVWLGAAAAGVALVGGQCFGRLPARIMGDGFMTTSLEGWRNQMYCAAVFCLVLSGAWPACDAVCRDRFLGWTGRISYGIYVLHFPVYLVIQRLPIAEPVIAPLSVGVTFGMAWASYRWFERPIMDGVRRWIYGESRSTTQRAAEPRR